MPNEHFIIIKFNYQSHYCRAEPSRPHSCHCTLTMLPSSTILATGSPRFPVAASLPRITTSSLSCKPIATRVPHLFKEKCLGKDPPAGQTWVKVRVPSWLRAKVDMVSERMAVEFLGSGLGMEKDESFLFETMRKRLSGYKLNISITITSSLLCFERKERTSSRRTE